MKINPISAAEVEGASLTGVANRPNQRTGFGDSGMTPQALKERFSALGKLAINKINELIALFGDEKRESELLTALFTALSDEIDDQKRMSLSHWISHVESLLVKASSSDEGKVLTAQSGVAVWREPVKYSDSFLKIIKTYASIEEMHAGYETDGVPIGALVLIDTGSTEDEDTAKLFGKGASSYFYVADLSGAQGVQGVPGVGITGVSLTPEKGLDLLLSNGEHLYTDSVEGPQGNPGYTPRRGTDYWTAKDVAAMVASVAEQIREEEHGVGSWLFTDDPADPAEKYGGEWEQIADRSLVGAGGAYAVGDIGGVDTVALTTAQLPSHYHSPIGYGSWGTSDADHGGPGFTNGYVYVCSAANRSATWGVGRTGEIGGDEAHENRSPFYATYIWHRFA